MTIHIGATQLAYSLHGPIKSTVWDRSRSVSTFFGLIGELHLNGMIHGRNLTAWAMPTGYATHAALQTDIAVYNTLIGTFGDVVWAVGADTSTFLNCVFEGFELDEDPWLDGSGVNGWSVLGHLNFRHILQ